jgi:hypothetical protein
LLSQHFVQEDSKMKRMAPFFHAILFAAYGGLTNANAQAGCTRDALNGIVDKYIRMEP